MTDDTLSTICAYISEAVLKQPGKVIEPDRKLISSGLIDSFSLVDLAMFIEERFGAVIADTELNAQTFDTPAQLAALVDQRKK